MGLPIHAKFNVERTFDNQNGITSPKASVLYGPTSEKPMLRFRDAVILMVDNRLYGAYKKEVEPARPVHTSMKAISLNVALGDVLNSNLKETIDGKTFIKIQDGGITELIQVDSRLLTTENLNKSQQLIKAEQNWKTKETKKDTEYISYMLEGNDQASIPNLNGGDVRLKDILNLLLNKEELNNPAFVKEFLKEYGNLKVYLRFQDKDVAGGLVLASTSAAGTSTFLTGSRSFLGC